MNKNNYKKAIFQLNELIGRLLIDSEDKKENKLVSG